MLHRGITGRPHGRCGATPWTIWRRCNRNAPPIVPPTESRPGALALALAADTDAAPLVRITAIHQVYSNSGEGTDRALVLDMPGGQVASGRPVLDAAGALLGMAIIGAVAEAAVIPYSALAGC